MVINHEEMAIMPIGIEQPFKKGKYNLLLTTLHWASYVKQNG
jgi:hypothetical protein